MIKKYRPIFINSALIAVTILLLNVFDAPDNVKAIVYGLSFIAFWGVINCYRSCSCAKCPLRDEE